MRRHRHEDDDRLLVVDAAGIGAARGLARSRAATLGFSERRVDDVVLAVSELVTNALQHGGGDVVVEASSSDSEVATIEFAVSSVESSTAPVRGEPAGPSQPRGRGLAIVESVADSVRVDRGDGRVVVRCTFAGPS